MSVPTLRRLPAYLAYLEKAQAAGVQVVSGTDVASALQLESIQVRKDLALTGVVGRPGVGFPVTELITSIKGALGWNNTTDAFLVGAGNLGAALVGYRGFAEFGLNIVAAFDIDPARIGLQLSGKPVFHLDRLGDLVQRMHVQMGILTVTAASAQAAADRMVEGGIRAIWNFTGTLLQVPPDIIVEKVDLAASLAVLSSRLAERIRRELKEQDI